MMKPLRQDRGGGKENKCNVKSRRKRGDNNGTRVKREKKAKLNTDYVTIYVRNINI